MKKILYLSTPLLMAASTLFGGNVEVNPEKSHISVDARATPPHTVTVFVPTYQCDLEMDPDTLEVKNARFSFKCTDLSSEHEKRDKKMHEWAESSSYPEGEFLLNEVINRDGHTIGKGNLTFHGITQPLEIPFTVSRDGGTIELDGSAEFSYENWGLEIIKLFIFRVRPDLIAHIHLEGILYD